MTQAMTAGTRICAEAVVAKTLPAIQQSYVNMFAEYGAQERADGCARKPGWQKPKCIITVERALNETGTYSWLEVIALEMEKLSNEGNQAEISRRLAKISALFIEWQMDRHRSGRPAAD